MPNDLTSLVKKTALKAGAIAKKRSVEFKLGGQTFRHAPLDCDACIKVHQGWDPHYSPFVDKNSSEKNIPKYFEFIRHRFRHHSICGARGCIRACMDHLEKTGRIEKQYKTPMIEGEQWVLEDL